MVTDDWCHETDFLEAWSSFDASDQVPVNFELVFFLPLAPTTCCSPLHFWTTYGQDFFLARLFCLRPLQHSQDCGIAISLDKNLSALEQLLWDVPDFPLIYRPRSMMQTDAWKSQSGWQIIPLFVQCDQLLSCSVSLKTSVATTRPVQLRHERELQQLQRVSDARGGAAFLCRLSESEYRRPLGFLSNMDTFCSRLYDGWPLLSSSKDQLRHDGPLPKTCPCTIFHKEFKGVTHENEFVSSSASLGMRFWALVLSFVSNFIGHASLWTGGSSSGVSPNAETSNTFSSSTSS